MMDARLETVKKGIERLAQKAQFMKNHDAGKAWDEIHETCIWLYDYISDLEYFDGIINGDVHDN